MSFACQLITPSPTKAGETLEAKREKETAKTPERERDSKDIRERKRQQRHQQRHQQLSAHIPNPTLPKQHRLSTHTLCQCPHHKLLAHRSKTALTKPDRLETHTQHGTSRISRMARARGHLQHGFDFSLAHFEVAH